MRHPIFKNNQSVSVIIPVYNEEKYIRDCCASLGQQTLKPLEIIVVDDGSSDQTLQILSEIPTIDSKLKIFKQKHQGPARARNKGVKKAQGEILVFPDADMRFEPKYLEKLVKPIVDKQAVATFTKEEYVANPENLWSWCWSLNSGWPVNLHIDPLMPEAANNFRAILKSTFLSTKGYQDVGYGEDVTVLAQLKGIKAKVAPGAICYHFNPSTLGEVFTSARWMGRGETMSHSLFSILIYTFPNSLRKGLLGFLKHRRWQFIIFKIVFDLAVLIGIMEKEFRQIHKK